MRKFYYLVIAFIFITGIAAGAIWLNRLPEIAWDGTVESMSAMGTARKPEHHFVFISQNVDEPFWQSVKKGAQAAAKEYNAAVEFNGPRFTSIAEEIQYLDIAIASKVDGIVTHVLDEKRMAPYIDKAVSKGIPVITIETDAKNSKRASFVGTNSYNLGAEWGKMIIQATGGSGTVAMIINSYSSDEGENTTQNLVISGLKDAIKEFPGIKIKTVQASQKGIFSAEEVTMNILSQLSEVDTILCTSAKDTLGVVQILLELNKLGYTVIGYDDTPEILKYIEKGVIYGTVVSNPVKMGFESVKALVEIKRKNRTSAYIATDVQAITGDTVAGYKNAMQIESEQGAQND